MQIVQQRHWWRSISVYVNPVIPVKHNPTPNIHKVNLQKKNVFLLWKVGILTLPVLFASDEIFRFQIHHIFRVGAFGTFDVIE